MEKQIDFDKLKGLNYFYCKDIRDNRGKKIGTQSYETVKTNSENIPIDEWYNRIKLLSKKYNEEHIIRLLKYYIKHHSPLGFDKNEKEIENRALAIYLGRYWEDDNSAWVDFREKYLVNSYENNIL